jgi:hypothetical protein
MAIGACGGGASSLVVDRMQKQVGIYRPGSTFKDTPSVIHFL